MRSPDVLDPPMLQEGGPKCDAPSWTVTGYMLSRKGNMLCWVRPRTSVVWQKNVSTRARAPEIPAGVFRFPRGGGRFGDSDCGALGTAFDKKNGKTVWISGRESGIPPRGGLRSGKAGWWRLSTRNHWCRAHGGERTTKVWSFLGKRVWMLMRRPIISGDDVFISRATDRRGAAQAFPFSFRFAI